MQLSRRFCALLGFVLLSGCAQPPAASRPEDPPASPGIGGGGNSQDADWAAIVALEGQAKAIAKTSGCSTDSECRAAPVGSRACGGPRYYIPYCARTTDSAALFRKLAEVAAAERAYNSKNQLASTCEFRMPPTVGVAGGACQAREER